MCIRDSINILSNASKFTPEAGEITFVIEELPESGPDYADYRFTLDVYKRQGLDRLVFLLISLNLGHDLRCGFRFSAAAKQKTRKERKAQKQLLFHFISFLSGFPDSGFSL